MDEATCPENLYRIIRANHDILTTEEKTVYKEILASTTWTGSYAEVLICEQDANKKYTNCSGVPRSVYKDVTW